MHSVAEETIDSKPAFTQKNEGREQASVMSEMETDRLLQLCTNSFGQHLHTPWLIRLRNLRLRGGLALVSNQRWKFE